MDLLERLDRIHHREHEVEAHAAPEAVDIGFCGGGGEDGRAGVEAGESDVVEEGEECGNVDRGVEGRAGGGQTQEDGDDVDVGGSLDEGEQRVDELGGGVLRVEYQSVLEGV